MSQAYRRHRYVYTSPLVQLKTEAILAQIIGKWSALTLNLSCNCSFQLSNVRSVLFVNNGGFVTFVDYSNITQVLKGLLRHCDKAAKTITSLWVSNNDLSLDTKVSLALDSSHNHSISALAVMSSTWGFKAMAISLSKVFVGPTAALLIIIFWAQWQK